MMVKAFAHLLFAVSLINFFPIDGAWLEWQAGVSRSTEGLGANLMASEQAVLPQAKNVTARPPKKTDQDSFGVVTTAHSVVVIDAATGQPLFTKNPNQARSIGSISKLASALVFLDTQPDLESLVSIEPEDFAGGGRVFLYYDDSVRLKDILGTSLVGSDNTATMALVRLSGLSTEDFVARMNTLALDLGLTQTRFADPSGLSAQNVSTAGEVAVLLAAAQSRGEIAKYMQTQALQVTHHSGRSVTVPSTNQLLDSALNKGDYSITAGKTGYIPQAGYCLAVGVERVGDEILIVVLGAQDTEARFDDVLDLASWSYHTFEWPKL